MPDQTPKEVPIEISRRTTLTALAVAPVAVKAATKTRPDPRTSASGIVKLQADLTPGRLTPWWYEVALYAIVGDAAPELVLRAEGCETYIMRPDAGGGYRSHGATVTAFKDPIDGQWIDDFANPWTGRRDTVRPNRITDSVTVFPPDGSVPLPLAKPSQPQPAGWLRWIESGDRIGCMIERRATGSIQPIMETASLWCERAAFFDPNTPRVEAVFTSIFASPWLGWMNMADVPGHLLWFSSGRKLRSISDLPPGYRRRSELLAPGALAGGPALR